MQLSSDDLCVRPCPHLRPKIGKQPDAAYRWPAQRSTHRPFKMHDSAHQSTMHSHHKDPTTETALAEAEAAFEASHDYEVFNGEMDKVAAIDYCDSITPHMRRFYACRRKWGCGTSCGVYMPSCFWKTNDPCASQLRPGCCSFFVCGLQQHFSL